MGRGGMKKRVGRSRLQTAKKNRQQEFLPAGRRGLLPREDLDGRQCRERVIPMTHTIS